MRKFGRHFKHCLCPVITIAAMMLLSGCTGDTDTVENRQKYENLDLSNTSVIMHIPESGEWRTLSFDYPSLSDDTITVMRKIADEYGGFTLDSGNILCNIYVSDDNGFVKESYDADYADMTPQQYDMTAYIRHIDDVFYMDFNAAGRIELYDRSAVKNILDITYDLTWSWRPYFGGGKEISSYDLLADENVADTYRLNGKDISVNDALIYATDYLNNGKLAHTFPKLYTYTPLTAVVYQFSDDAYGYFFEFQVNYDGVPFDAANATGDVFSNKMHICMLTEASVEWIWACVLTDDTPDLSAPCEITVDYDEACQIVSEKLSQEHVFNVKEAELLYCTYELDNEAVAWVGSGFVVEPMWQFTITDVGVQEYSIIYINVSATNGEVYLRYE